MQHVRFSPVPMHARRPGLVPAASPALSRPEDARWRLLDLVRDCRSQLSLRDRDVAVLRGLLSLMPADASPAQMTVFASNRVLIARCDGIDERTLRRRLAHLEACGLVRRRNSPNGKRYQVRSPEEEAVLTYGIDLSPLFSLQPHLAALAESAAREAVQIKALRAMIRDWLYHHAGAAPELETEARLSLRRKLESAALQSILAGLQGIVAPELTATDSQNDRHIQSSKKEDFDSDTGEDLQAVTQAAPCAEEAQDLTVEECLELAGNARSLSPTPPRDWTDLSNLSAALAPAIGLSRGAVDQARSSLGVHGCTLAILGLVEAFDRIRKPEAYLAALSKQARESGLDMLRMFRSLTNPRRVLG